MNVKIERLGDAPIIRPHMDGQMGGNVNGPSLVEMPDWVADRLGRYYLYFAHHDGQYIRLAYADDLTGPWRMHEAGVMPIADSRFAGHIASPDVHIDNEARHVRMYFHGSEKRTGQGLPQHTRVALSDDGLHFVEREEILGRAYMRTIRHGGWHYAMAMPGIIYRSRDGLSDFETGPTPFALNMRHAALLAREQRLLVFFTQIGDEPERILLSSIDLATDWQSWRPSPPIVVLEPERDYEGGNLELRPSARGMAAEPVRQLRDPAVFETNDGLYLLYAVAGEHGIAIARLALSEG